jgi:hypothetical protein
LSGDRADAHSFSLQAAGFDFASERIGAVLLPADIDDYYCDLASFDRRRKSGWDDDRLARVI